MTSSPIVVHTSDGLAIAAHDLGGEGAPLVMVHAAGLHGLVLEPLGQQLGPDFRCVSLDGRGHGDSKLPPGHRLDWYGLAADVLAVVDGLSLDRPYGFGHSSGATAVLMAEQARPGTFAAIYCFEPVIVAADPPLGRDDDSWMASRARHRRNTFESRQEAWRHYSSKPPLDGLAPEVLRAYVDHGFENDGDGVRLKCDPENEATIYEMATAHDAYARLPEIGCPVTLACGAETEACTPERARALVDRLPRGRSEVLDHVGHFGPLERPREVAASVRRFLAGAARERPSPA
ncbi:MAG: alpha/beta hydrolase [Actinomycetota bacterium]|nr:alpha/beta hydrolase [Actinomycetota bacterium]